MDLRKQLILDYLGNQEYSSSTQIFNAVKRKTSVSKITINRDLKELTSQRLLNLRDKARATKYSLSPEYNILRPIEVKEYFSKETDDRRLQRFFNFEVFNLLKKNTELFTNEQLNKLNKLNNDYRLNIQSLSPTIIKREFERVIIEFSWKSSHIEGNTYSLLETEALLREGLEASGKTKQEGIMILNHKTALNLILENLSYFKDLSPAKIETIHSILTKDLGIPRNIRKTLVGITGTNYKPLDNEFQIREALEKMCDIINSIENIFAKAMLVILLISYIQPFEDGNKRTGRILGNAILLANNSFPLSFRTMNEMEYKEAILIFYELNNLYNFRKLFIEQAEFSVNTYFVPSYSKFTNK